MEQPIIEIKNLKKKYDSKIVLDIPHLIFNKGLIYALAGPNGSGKTTLLKIINLLESKSEGEIYIDGKIADTNSSNALNIKRQMTIVMQNAVLFRTSVYNNVAYGLKVRSYNKSQIAPAVSSALDMVGLGGFENRKAKQLSAGEAQRVALARALVLSPNILLLDEPTANIDRKNIQTVEALLNRINKEFGTTIIFTTHDLSQAYRMTKNVISLIDGKIMGGGSENIFYGSFFKDKNQKSFINISQSMVIRIKSYQSDNVGISIHPKDVKISLKPDVSDQLNCLKGKIISANLINGKVRLIIDAGLELISMISQDEFQTISSNIFSQDIYAIIDLLAVNVF